LAKSRSLNKFCIITLPGLEQLAADELESQGIENPLLFQGGVLCSSRPPKLQSAVHVLALTEEIGCRRFMVKVSPYDPELEAELIQEAKQKGGVLDYKNPEVVLRAFPLLGLKGLDSAKAPLSKRSYRVFTTRHSLNPVSAYALGRLTVNQLPAGFIATSDGTPAIEASIAINSPVDCFGLDGTVLSGAKKNAIVAGAQLNIKEAWKAELKSLGIPLNFKRSAKGRTPQSIASQAAASFSPATLVLLTLEQASISIEGYSVVSRLGFSQGGLRLALIVLSSAH
jgi:hypothetical protein